MIALQYLAVIALLVVLVWPGNVGARTLIVLGLLVIAILAGMQVPA